jgi:hypothetical protein
MAVDKLNSKLEIDQQMGEITNGESLTEMPDSP